MSGTGVVIHGSANLLNRGLRAPVSEQVQVLSQAQDPPGERAHSWGVQEIVGRSDEEAARVLIELADECGMSCYISTPVLGRPLAEQVAIAPADSWASREGHRFYTGLMWQPGITPVAGTFQAYGRARARLWHSLTAIELDYGGVRIRVCCGHDDVFDPQARISEAMQIAWIANSGDVPTLVSRDTNCLAASRVRLPWSQRWRRPWHATDWSDPDWYIGTDWYPERIHQLDPTAPGMRGDRRADRVLVDPEFGRLIDLAVHAGGPLEMTTGHWPADRHPPRRVDRIYGSCHFHGQVLRFRVLNSDAAKRSSDHLPVLAYVRTTDLASAPGPCTARWWPCAPRRPARGRLVVP